MSDGFNPNAGREVPMATKQKNAGLALALLGFVGGVYYTAISKMQQTDALDLELDAK